MKSITKYTVQLVKEHAALYAYDTDVFEKSVIKPEEAARLINEIFHLDVAAEEHMVMLCLNAKCRIVGAFEISSGSLSASIVHPREVFKRAMLCNAYSIILCHNHPSENSEPSGEDIKITERLKQAGELLGIHVLDHIIIGTPLYSFKKNDRL